MTDEPSWAWASVDDPFPYYPKCDRCTAFARWSIARCEGDTDMRGNLTWITRWFACGQHINKILTEEDWCLDAVQVHDLTIPPERS